MKNFLTIEIPEKRNFGLDLLRFIAIFTVLVSHSITLLPAKFKFIELFITDGVLIFFVLSGFLIGRILIRDFKADINPSKMFYFWKRRWFRTLPAYFFTILIIVFLSYLTHSHMDKIEVLRTIFFVQNIDCAPASFFPESWSLAIEEWFYLLLPLLLFVFHKLFRLSIKNNILLSSVIILLLSTIIRIKYFYTLEISSIVGWDNAFRKPVITRLDSILVGVLGAWFYIYKNTLFQKYKNIFFILGITTFLLNKIYIDYFLKDFGFYDCVLYFFIIPFSVLLVIPFVYYLKNYEGIFSRMISYTSLVSYSLYLLNYTVIMNLIIIPQSLSPGIQFLLFWILIPAFSILMYKYIEQPFMRLRGH